MINEETLIPISLTSTYCSSWGVWETCREFLANALDADDNCTYEVNGDTLEIKSNGGTIPYEYLLMGGGSKSVGGDTLGCHNEGSKVAMVVGLREGLSITIRNGNQLWTPEMHYSELFKIEHLHVKVLEDGLAWEHSDVEITISGISEEDLEKLEKNFLYFQEDLNIFPTEQGDILLDEAMKGYIFVGGMFVCVDNNLSKGYNFKPNQLKLDRDRSLARTWDIIAITDNMIAEMSNSEEHVDTIVDMVTSNCQDVTHLAWNASRVSNEVVEKLHDNFIRLNGESAVVAESFEEQTQLLNSGYKKVIYTGNSVSAQLIKRSSNYRALSSPVVVKRCGDYLQEYLDKYENEMSTEMFNDFEDMATKLKEL